MDFTLNDEEQAIYDLVEQIIGDHSTNDRLKQIAAADDHVDRDAWAALAAAGVVGAAIPEAHGGLGLGYLATAMAIQVAASHGSPVPLLTTSVMGSMPIAEYGTETQRAAWLPAIADGSLLAAAALHETGTPPASPLTTARADGDGYVLDGVKPMVDGGLQANVLLVPARMPDRSVGVFLVPCPAGGVSCERVEVTTGRPQAHVTFSGVVVGADALLGGGAADGAEIVHWIARRAIVAMCMQMAGAARSAIRLAADYTKERQQFDRPIATFQAVSNRAGDSYIDTEAITLTAWQAAWHIDQGLPADEKIHMAAYWAAEGGFRVVHAATHVHGGVGVDRDYPLHRHFLLARQIELTLGNSEEHLERLGHSIATS
ncbi:MAG: acyl-CoA dehydrogenase family protein [Acidimicrobiales bacterium]|nr:acyl-CoA dehydrogenase family protein [Acidimicrobiales bacterium]